MLTGPQCGLKFTLCLSKQKNKGYTDEESDSSVWYPFGKALIEISSLGLQKLQS